MGSCEGSSAADRGSSDRSSSRNDGAERSREAADAARRTETARAASEVATRAAASVATGAGAPADFKAGQEQLDRVGFEARERVDRMVRDALSQPSAPSPQSAAASAQTTAAGLTATQAATATSTAAAVATGSLQTVAATQTAAGVALQTATARYDLSRVTQTAAAAQAPGQIAAQASAASAAVQSVINASIGPAAPSVSAPQPANMGWAKVAVSAAQAVVTRSPLGFAVKTAAALATDGIKSRVATLEEREAAVAAGTGLNVNTASGRLAAREFWNGVQSGTLRGIVAGQAAAIIELKEPGITNRAVFDDAALQRKNDFIRSALASVPPGATSWGGWTEAIPELSEEDRKLLERVEGFTAGLPGPQVLADPTPEFELPSHTGNPPAELPTSNVISTPVEEMQKPNVVANEPGLPNNGVDYTRKSTAKSYQATAPRTLFEQSVWNGVLNNPQMGRNLVNMNNDQDFRSEDGFRKKEVSVESAEGQRVTIHYQYNENTGKAYDMKIAHPKIEGVEKATPTRRENK